MLPVRDEPNPSHFAPPFLVQRWTEDTDLSFLTQRLGAWRQVAERAVPMPEGNFRIAAVIPLATGPAYLSTSFPLPGREEKTSLGTLIAEDKVWGEECFALDGWCCVTHL